jgi:hypothetical protein
MTIRPAANKNVIVQTNGYDGFHFINVSYLTLDGVGLSGSTTLMLNIQNNDLWQIQSAIDFENNCDFNVVTNVTVMVEDYINGWGIDLNVFNAGTTNTPDYNLLQNNFIKQAGIAIIAAGFRSGATLPPREYN